MRARISDPHTGLRQAIGGAPLQTITVGPNQADCAHLPALRRPRQYVLNSVRVQAVNATPRRVLAMVS